MNWLLYFLFNFMLSLFIFLKGRCVLAAASPEKHKAGWTYSPKWLETGSKPWLYAQKVYGDAAWKGGLALMILNLVVSLCTLSLDEQTIQIGAAIMLGVEVLFYFGLGFWTKSRVQSRFDSTHTPSSSSHSSSDSADQEDMDKEDDDDNSSDSSGGTPNEDSANNEHPEVKEDNVSRSDQHPSDLLDLMSPSSHSVSGDPAEHADELLAGSTAASDPISDPDPASDPSGSDASDPVKDPDTEPVQSDDQADLTDSVEPDSDPAEANPVSDPESVLSSDSPDPAQDPKPDLVSDSVVETALVSDPAPEKETDPDDADQEEVDPGEAARLARSILHEPASASHGRKFPHRFNPQIHEVNENGYQIHAIAKDRNTASFSITRIPDAE